MRRAGQLQEALALAEEAFGRCADRYSAPTLFWCLRDLFRQQTADGRLSDEAAATLERMTALFNDFGSDDEFMKKALASAQRLSLPHSQGLKEAVEQAKKGGNALALFHQAAQWYRAGELDPQLFPDFGWLTYYALRQTAPGDAANRRVLLHQYLQLNLPRPDLLHSLILSEAITLEKASPLQFRVRDFVRLWGLENLRDEDWEQFTTEAGQTVTSTVEKLIGVYAKELKTDRVRASEEFNRLVDLALEKFPNNQNMPYYKAIVLLSQDRVEEALNFFKSLILRFPSKQYLWEQCADMVQDRDLKIGLLCKALSGCRNDEFLGKMRQKLATLLREKGLNANARFEFDKVRETYQNQGWNLKPAFWEAYNTLSGVEAARDNREVYREYAVKADEFIYSSLPTVVAVKVSEFQDNDHHRPGRTVVTWSLRTGSGMLRLRRPATFGLSARQPNGSVFDVKVQDKRIVWISPHVGEISEPWLKTVSGEARLRTDRNGRRFAIIDGVYVSEALLSGVSEGEKLTVLATQQRDGRWSAIKATPCRQQRTQ